MCKYIMERHTVAISQWSHFSVTCLRFDADDSFYTLIQETIQTIINIPIIVPGLLIFEFLEGKKNAIIKL